MTKFKLDKEQDLINTLKISKLMFHPPFIGEKHEDYRERLRKYYEKDIKE